jgi:hypothetical protein
VHGIAAALLPFESDGRIAVDAFQQHLKATHQAGLTNAVNMDTGYVNHLNSEEKQQVLGWARESLGPATPFVAGAYIEGNEGSVATHTGGRWIASRVWCDADSFPDSSTARIIRTRKGFGVPRGMPWLFRGPCIRTESGLSRPTERFSMRTPSAR